jgi:ABC-type Mn2+/Zn2+ transport system permease subunit
MQTLCLGQASLLGVLLGVGFTDVFLMSMAWQAGLPFVLGFLLAGLTYVLSDLKVSQKGSSSNTHFAALFVALLACSHMISALFPALETHMAQKYFGDLATMGDQAGSVALIVGAVVVLVFVGRYRQISGDSFAAAISGARPARRQIFLGLGGLAAICFSVQVVGFLFTIACLFVPTSILSFGKHLGLRKHLVLCSVVATLGCGGGFVLSLWESHLPTVPTIALLMILMAVVCNLFARPRTRLLV